MGAFFRVPAAAGVMCRLYIPTLDDEKLCGACVLLGPGFIDGPAARDVQITAVVGCLDTWNWLEQALGDQQLDDGRTQAQVAVGQAEFADVIVVDHIDKATLAVLSRLAPRASVVRDNATSTRPWRAWARTPAGAAATIRSVRC